MNVKVCEHHEESPLFRFHAKTAVDGQIENEEFEFCRYCAGSRQVTCPSCKTILPVVRIDSETAVSASISTAFLKCNRCETVIASADIV